MFKARRIVKRTAAALLAASGFVMLVWGHDLPASAHGAPDPVKAVGLRLTFGGGDRANVSAAEGGTIKVEQDGKRPAIVPSIRERGGGEVELRVFQVARRGGEGALEPVNTLLVNKGPTKLDAGGPSFGVWVTDAGRSLPGELLAAPAAMCCARTCNGTLVRGVCVCTDCGVCFTHGWRDCSPPAPPEQ